MIYKFVSTVNYLRPRHTYIVILFFPAVIFSTPGRSVQRQLKLKRN